MIRTDELTLQYPTADEPAIEDVSLSVPSGEVLGVVGPVDAGKTTLAMALAGHAPQVTGGTLSGDVEVAGHDPQEGESTDVAIVFEDYSSQLTQVRVRDEIVVPLLTRGFGREEARERASELLEMVRLGGYEDERTWELSGGEQQRVAIAAALATDPDALVFDTAMAMLDPAGTDEVTDLVASLADEMALVVTANDPELLVGLADEVVVMDDGRVVADGRADDVLRRHDLFESVGVRPPTPLRVAAELGLDAAPVTADEFVDALDSTRTDDAPRERAMPDGSFGDPVLSLSDVTFRYDDDAAVDDVDLTVREGEVHAVLGGNGAGKTTLTKLCAGLLDPDEGEVVVDGVPTADATARELGEHVGLAFQNPDTQVSKRTVEEEVRFPLEQRQYERSRWLGRKQGKRYGDDYVERRTRTALERTGLDEDGVVGDDPTTLSMGRRRLTAIAAALSTDPPTVVLDEPTAGLDANGYDRMRDLVRDLKADGKAVVLVEHDMEFVCEVADRVTVLDEGRVAETGPPESVFARENWSALEDHYLDPPTAARLARRVGVDALTTPELVDALDGEVVA